MEYKIEKVIEDIIEKGRKVKDLEDLRRFLQYATSVLFGKHGCEVYFHGSRARGCNRPTSDIDVAIILKSDSTDILFATSLIEEALEESRLPYKVDLKILTKDANDKFIKRVITEGIKWL